MNFKIQRQRGAAFIGILIAVILFLVMLAMLLYLLIHLCKIPPRNLPREAGAEWAPYVYEPIVADLTAPEAPAGLQYRKAPLLASTNLQNWETVLCEVDAAGYIRAPDGSLLQLWGEWSEELQQWTELFPAVVRGGTNQAMFFRVP